MFSLTAEYALRAMVFLAQQAPSHCTTEQISEAAQVPRAYLAKVLQALSRAGLVQSQRGIGGGMALARPAAGISVLEIINAVDPIRRVTGCPLHLAEHDNRLCPLHRRLDATIAGVEQVFARTFLAELLPGTLGRAGPREWITRN